MYNCIYPMYIPIVRYRYRGRYQVPHGTVQVVPALVPVDTGISKEASKEETNFEYYYSIQYNYMVELPIPTGTVVCQHGVT